MSNEKQQSAKQETTEPEQPSKDRFAPVIAALKLILEIQLRQCMYNDTPRRFEDRIKEAVTALE